MTADRRCERCWELADARAAGAALSAEDERWLAEHLRSCPDCALEQRLAAVAGDLDAAGPAAPLDELGRQRWAEGVLERVAATPAAPSRRRRWPRVALAVALAASVAAVAVALWRYLRPPAAPRPTLAARAFLAAGAVRRGAAPLAAGDPLRPGDRVEVREGRAGLRLCGGAAFFLDARTTIALRPAAPRRCAVGLSRGRVVIRSAGLPAGVKLAVVTPTMEVSPRGTVFAVEVDARGTEVRVLRGAVVAARRGRPPRRVRAMQRLGSGGEIAAVSAPQAGRDRRLSAWDEPRAGPQSARLSVASEPPGAAVAVDGKPLGAAPVTALLGAGERRIEVRWGAQIVREQLSLKPGERVSRVYRRARSRAGAGAAAADAGAAVPDARAARPSPPRRPRPPRPRPPRVTAAGLLAKARAARAARDFAAAIRGYRELIRRFPGSGQARAALVSLGDLLLRRNDAARALAAFERYLAQRRGGPLAEEATWGRIRALRRLGRRKAEAQALRRFIRAHPSSLNVGRARRRLTALQQKR